MKIALASPRVASSLDDGLARIQRLTADAAGQGAAIICFPEAYLPGLYGVDIDVLPFGRADELRVLQATSSIARENRIAVILGTEASTPAGRLNLAVVFDENGQLLGRQTKNQIAPAEDPHYVPGSERSVFEVQGMKFGIAICHEGWRYPETVRWAAVRGAQIVFHPQHTGSNTQGIRLTQFGSLEAPYYEKALVMRGIENTIWFASVNYALAFPESATCIIAPDGKCRAYLPYGQEGVLVHDIDLSDATGLIAKRYAPDRHQ